MIKINSYWYLFVYIAIHMLFCADIVCAPNSMCKMVIEKDLISSDALWDSKPCVVSRVSLQILDKISGNVLRKEVNIGEEVHYGTLCVSVERAFKNSPDDRPEVYAYVKIQENEVTQFENWLFASSPSANLFVHAVYDVRVEF